MFAECIPYKKHIHHVEILSMAITCPNQPLEYVDFIIESSMKEKVQRLDTLQHKALRRIEYCKNPEDRET